MTHSLLESVIRKLEDDLIYLEGIVSEPGYKTEESGGCFSRNETINNYKNSTRDVRLSHMNLIYIIMKEISEYCEGLTAMQKDFPYEPRILELNKRFSRCGHKLLEVYNLMKSWDLSEPKITKTAPRKEVSTVDSYAKVTQFGSACDYLMDKLGYGFNNRDYFCSKYNRKIITDPTGCIWYKPSPLDGKVDLNYYCTLEGLIEAGL